MWTTPLQVSSRPIVCIYPIAPERQSFDPYTPVLHTVAYLDLCLQAPLCEALQVCNVNVHELVVQLFQTCFVQATDPEFARSNILWSSYQVNRDRVIYAEPQTFRMVT